MAQRDAPTTAGPVVICCAAADGDTIRPLVEDLEAQGHAVTLLEGVERSPASLSPAVERLHGEGLYVLCRSKALGRAAVDELRDILLAHHVPFGRTLTVASTRPRELRERIGASLRRLATGKARRMSTLSPDGPPARTTRLGVSPPPPAPVAAASPPEPPKVSRSTRLGLPAAQRSTPSPGGPPSLRSAPPVPATAPPRTPSVAAATDPVPARAPLDAAAEDPFEAEAPANLTPAVEEEPEVPAREPSVEALINADELSDLDDELADLELDLDEALSAELGAPSPTGLPVPVRTGSTTVSPVIPRSTLDAIRTGDTAIVSREALIAAGLPSPEAPPAPPAGQTLRATPSALAGGTVRSVATVLPEDDGDSRKPPWVWIGAGAAALLFVGLIAFAIRGGEDKTDETDDTVLAQAQDSSEGAASPQREDQRAGKNAASVREDFDAPPAADRPAAAESEGGTRIGHALRTRAVRALDVLLVSSTEGPLSWEAAKEHCGGLEQAGLSTWRLPAVGELMSLTQAQMTERGYYWSSTPADTFGDTPLVWYAKRNRIVTRDQDNLVLCVRGGSVAG